MSEGFAPNRPRERSAFFPALLIAATIAVFAGRALAADTTELAQHVRTLSSAAFQGRFPGTIGEERSISYIGAEFRKAGLTPGGDMVGGERTWFQTVPMIRSTITGQASVKLSTSTGVASWTRGEDIAILSTLVDGPRLVVTNAPVVFLGTTLPDPARSGRELDGLDMKGKIALVLFRPPPRAIVAQSDAIGSHSPQPPPSKTEQAIAGGAAGVLTIFEPEVLGYPWQTIRSSFDQPRLAIPRQGPKGLHPPLEGFVRYEAAAALFRAAGLDLPVLTKQAQARDFQPVPLSGSTLSADYPVEIVHTLSHNVVGRLVGTTRPDETVIFGAHWDHEGVGKPDASGDPIYHGALDNASGVAGLIEIGRGLAQKTRTERSLLFVAWTLEEPGLLGSSYYAEHPLYPLETTVADFTMDCLLPIGRSRDFSGWGYEDSTVGDWVTRAGEAQGRRYSPLGHPEWAVKYRSDHYSLMKKGVPALYFFSGTDLVTGGTPAGDKYMTEYFAHRYHQQSDRYDPSWNMDGIAQDVDLLVEAGHGLANSGAWPVWKSDSEFKPVRDLSAAARR